MPSHRRTLLVLAAILLALAGAALAARFVVEFGAVTVDVLPGRPTALPTNVASRDDLGREIALADAQAIVGFPPALPSALGPPVATWLDEARIDPESRDLTVRIVTEWLPSADLPIIAGTQTGALLMQFQSEWEVASKLVFAETNRFRVAVVDGDDAFWTTGEHELRLVSGDETRRLLVTGNVLIWQDGGFTFRLETSLPKLAAVAIAESVHPAPDLG